MFEHNAVRTRPTGTDRIRSFDEPGDAVLECAPLADAPRRYPAHPNTNTNAPGLPSAIRASDLIDRKPEFAAAPDKRQSTHIVFAVTALPADPNSVVVELGCGLETRVHRLTPPATVHWYDVDFDNVIALRQRVLPELDSSHLVAASLTDPDWLDGIPRDHPAIVVADGVLGFLTEADNRQLLNALTDHITAGGELVFNTYTRFVASIMGKLGMLCAVAIPKCFQGFEFNDPREVERLNPRLAFVEEQIGDQTPEVAQFPWPTRMIAKLFARWRAQGRRGVWIVRYRFG